MLIGKATKNDIDKCLRIAKSLPEWFNERGIQELEQELPNYPVYVYKNNELLGFACIKSKSDKVIEIAYMAVARDKQREGVGSALLDYIKHELPNSKLIEVKTLDESCDYKPYIQTRAFYKKNGFLKVEVIDPYPGWEKENPCAIFVKPI